VAEGEYFMFLDADDLLHRDGVAWLVEAMEGRQDRICLMGFRKFDGHAALSAEGGSLPPDERPLARRLLFENLGPPHAFLCPKDRARAIGGFDDRWRYACEDWDFWLRLVLNGADVVAVLRIGAYYRRHDGTLSTNRARMYPSTAERLLQVQEEVRARPDLLRRWGLTFAEVRKRHKPLLREALLGAAYNVRKQGDYRRSLGYYLSSIWRAGWSREAMLGLLKLGPQRLLRK